jgi:hypothetical protein
MKKFLTAFAVFAALSLAVPVIAEVPQGKSTAQEIVVTPAAPEAPTDPCGDSFSNPVRTDIVNYVNERTPSVVLAPFFGDDIVIFQSRGYCQPLDEAGQKLTAAELAASIIAELKAEADTNNYTITYVSKVIPILGGNMVAAVAKPPAEQIEAAGVDCRVFQVFVFNGTRIVGYQGIVSATGLKQP